MKHLQLTTQYIHILFPEIVLLFAFKNSIDSFHCLQFLLPTLFISNSFFSFLLLFFFTYRSYYSQFYYLQFLLLTVLLLTVPITYSFYYFQFLLLTVPITNSFYYLQILFLTVSITYSFYYSFFILKFLLLTGFFL